MSEFSAFGREVVKGTIEIQLPLTICKVDPSQLNPLTGQHGHTHILQSPTEVGTQGGIYFGTLIECERMLFKLMTQLNGGKKVEVGDPPEVGT